MPSMAPTAAPQAPPIMPQTSGLTRRRLTPKMAGSVIPKNAEREDGRARFLNLWFLVLRATAKQAAPCAKLAEEAMGIHVL